jgi:hypothetical protein
MRMTGAKRPGADALAAMADGLGVSMDWLMGRTGNPNGKELTDHDYALACFASVKEVLHRFGAVSQDADEALDKARLSQLDVSEVAALAMSIFKARLELFRETTIHRQSRSSLHKDFERASDVASSRSSAGKSIETGN